MEEKEGRIAVIGIILEDKTQAEQVNGLLHQYGSYIIGRMGLPYERKQVNIISVVLDAPSDVISALAGKLGRLQGASSKALYSKKETGKMVDNESREKGDSKNTEDRESEVGEAEKGRNGTRKK